MPYGIQNTRTRGLEVMRLWANHFRESMEYS